MFTLSLTNIFFRSNFGSRGGGGNGWNDDYDGFDGFGSGYGNGFGGGKMGNSGFMGGRNIPYNTRVATHEGDWDCPRSELTSRIFFNFSDGICSLACSLFHPCGVNQRVNQIAKL